MQADLAARDVRAPVRDDLAQVDDGLREAIERLLVAPRPHLRRWDYGKQGEAYECWIVAELDDRVEIAYSRHGHRPRLPWGLVFKHDDWYGPDSAWYPSLRDAVLDALPPGASA